MKLTTIANLVFVLMTLNLVYQMNLDYGKTWEFGRYGMPRSIDRECSNEYWKYFVENDCEEEVELAYWIVMAVLGGCLVHGCWKLGDSMQRLEVTKRRIAELERRRS